MTPEEVTAARFDLGVIWGLGRPLYASELGRILRLRGRDPGQQVLRWEAGKYPVNDTAALCIEMMLDGARPPGLDGLGAAKGGQDGRADPDRA